MAIARWDEEDHQGWKRLGVPMGMDIDFRFIEASWQNGLIITLMFNCHISEITTENGVILDMGAVIKDGMPSDFPPTLIAL